MSKSLNYRIVRLTLENSFNGESNFIVVATHNQESVLKAAETIVEQEREADSQLHFAQVG